MAVAYSPTNYPNAPKRAPTVEWSKYTDGRWWELERGVDFDEDQTSKQARKAFNTWAYRHGYRTTTRVLSDRVVSVRILPES